MRPASGAKEPKGAVPIPAVCGSCGNLFPSPILLGDGAVVNVGLVSVSPCPFCGGGASVPEGIYQGLGDAIQILAGGESTLNALRRLQRILERAQNDNASPEAVAEEIKTQVPRLAKIVSFVQKYPFALLIALVSVILSRFPPASKKQQLNVTNNVTNTIINQTFVQVNEASRTKMPKQVPIRRSKKKALLTFEWVREERLVA